METLERRDTDRSVSTAGAVFVMVALAAICAITATLLRSGAANPNTPGIALDSGGWGSRAEVPRGSVLYLMQGSGMALSDVTLVSAFTPAKSAGVEELTHRIIVGSIREAATGGCSPGKPVAFGRTSPVEGTTLKKGQNFVIYSYFSSTGEGPWEVTGIIVTYKEGRAVKTTSSMAATGIWEWIPASGPSGTCVRSSPYHEAAA